MEYTKHQALAHVIALIFLLFTLVNGACVQKEKEGPVHCCDQRENGGLLHCCEGRNSSCGMEDFVHNTLCFCDEFCDTAGDCCIDFESVKKPCGLGNGKWVDLLSLRVNICHLHSSVIAVVFCLHINLSCVGRTWPRVSIVVSSI